MPEPKETLFEEVTNLDNWTVTTSINFLCDDCRLDGRLTTLTTGLAEQDAAEQFAREQGWRKEFRIWRCPMCAYQSDLEDKADAQFS